MVLAMSCYSVGRSMLAGEKTVKAAAVDKLFIGMMAIIVMVSLYNTVKYLA